MANGRKIFTPYREPTMKADLLESTPNFATGSRLMVARDLPEGGFVAEPGRYHLYVALICPCFTFISKALAFRERFISFAMDALVGEQILWRNK